MNMLDLIGKILVSSIHSLFACQPDVLTDTPYTGMTEWNLGHHLANEIAKYIFWLSHDIDVTKHNYSNRRPDIIFHKRGSNNFNYLAVEIKINRNHSTSNHTSSEDTKRIKKDWMEDPLHYRFGASVVIKSADDFIVIVFGRGRCQSFSTSSPFIPAPKISESESKSISNLVNEILAITKDEDCLHNSAKQAKVRDYERQIDQLVYKLYSLTPKEIKIVENSLKKE